MDLAWISGGSRADLGWISHLDLDLLVLGDRVEPQHPPDVGAHLARVGVSVRVRVRVRVRVWVRVGVGVRVRVRLRVGVRARVRVRVTARVRVRG